jgi:hypothetical protein
MKTKTYLISSVCAAVIALCALVDAQTTPRTSSSPSVSPTTIASPAASVAKQGTRPFPFHGMVSAVDQTAKTFTIAGKKQSRVFKVTDKTSITKGAKTATMQDITENEEASGSYWKNADGTLEAKMVKLGPMGAKKSKGSAASAASPSASPNASPSPKP